MSTQKDREVVQARVDQAVAEDVAVGMAAKATQEHIRADVLAADNIRKSANLQEVRAQRDAAAVSGAVARNDARSASFGFYLLLGLVGVALLLGAIWFANRPEPTSNTTVINRTVTPAETNTRAPAAVPVQVQQPAPAPPSPPVVIERQVERRVEVPVPVPAPAERPARQPNQTIIIEPAQPAPSGEASEPRASGTAPVTEAPAETTP